MTIAAPQDPRRLSIVRGPPLSEEPDLGPLTIAGYARAVTKRFADREAVVLHGAHGRVSLSYGELWDYSIEIAKALIAAGLEKDGRVGVLMANRPEYLASVFGIALAGGVVVPLSTFSVPTELEYLLRIGGVSTLFYDRQVAKQHFGSMLCELEPQISGSRPGTLASMRFPYLQRLVELESVTGPGAVDDRAGGAVEEWGDFLTKGQTVPVELVGSRAAGVSPSDVGALFFSSGTTSLPKGILHAQRALAIQWWRWPRIMDLDAANHPVRCWTGNGFFWSGNLSMAVGNALTTGGAIVLQPVFEADAALELMEMERVSFPMGRPHQWARLESSRRWTTADLSSIHYVTNGAKLLEHPAVSTDWRMCPAYGTTETLTINTAVAANTDERDYRGSFGRPLPGNILKIFDPVSREVVPVGTRGEIAVKGPTLMLGYVGKALEESFDEDGFFCTGDGGYVDEAGLLFWEGRLTDMIKTGGANVSPLEVDEVLATIPGVKRAQTVGVPHPTLGEMVVACVVAHEGMTLDEKEIQILLKERLASFKVPRTVLLFREEEFAVTGSEKVKTGVLRELARCRLESEA